MNSFIAAWANFVVEKRVLVMALSFIAVLTGGFLGSGIAFDHTIERNFTQDDPRLKEFNQLLEYFGDNEYLIVGVSAKAGDKDVFNAPALKIVDAVTDFLERQAVVTQVRSLSKYQFIVGENDSLEVEDLFEQQRTETVSAGALLKARESILNERLAIGTLVTKDLRETRIAARIEYHKESPAHKVELVKALYQFIDTQGYAQQGYRIRMGGQAVFDEQFETQNKKDADILYPAMALIMIVILSFGFRSMYATLMPWIVIICGIVTLTGLQGVLGYPHSAVDQALVPTMIIVGIGVTMHVILEFFRLRTERHDSQTAAKKVIEKLWVPACFTAVTTALGFYTLSVTKIVPVKEMAYLGAAGTLMLFVFSFTLLPAVLSYSKKISKKTDTTLKTGWITVFTQKLTGITFNYRFVILAGAALLFAFSALTLPKIKVDTNFVEYFKSDNIARQDMQYFDDVFNGALTMEVIIDSGANDGIKDPAFLNRVAAFQQMLEDLDSTAEITSVIDYLKEVHQSLNNEQSAFYTIPDSREKVAQLLFLYENSGPEEDLSDMRDFDNRYLRLTVPMVNKPASAMEIELNTIKDKVAGEFADLNITLTGIKLLFQAQDIYTNEGMLKSFSLALLIISLFFIVLFRSFKYGLLCIIPSVLPILLTGGIITLLGLNLDLGTMIVGAMTMGIAVDDSIHMMSRYLSAKKEGNNTRDSIALALAEAGRAVIFSSIVLVLGFAVLTLGSFVPIINVGLFSACIMFLALIADLFILPATLYLLDGKGNQQSNNETLTQGETA